MNLDKTFDVAVIGAGVFGAWTAYVLKQAGADVILFDAYGPGNSRASSGGESRMIRMGYGPDRIYTVMAQRSLHLWQQLFASFDAQLFQPTGILWLAREGDPYASATTATLDQCGIGYERLDRAELSLRYPQLAFGEVDEVAWGIVEPNSGVLMARQAVNAVASAAVDAGVVYVQDSVAPGPGFEGSQTISKNEITKCRSVATFSGRPILAKQFVFACGPWLTKLFPALLSQLIQVTRQEVFFFGLPAGNSDRYCGTQMPAWIDFNNLVYGVPSLANRGFKIAIDAHGPEFDPDTHDRIASPDGLAAVRQYLARRIPALANAPVIETRVCQYENTSNGDFLIDRHPAFENVWIVGGGSGHGFKHGPAVGEYATALISGNAAIEPRFTLLTKGRVHNRTVY